MRRLAPCFCFLIGAALPSAVEAQTGEEQARARELFMEGRTHAAAEEWGLALVAFEGSLALVERASTMVSVAGVLVRLERGRDALAMLDRLRGIADPQRDRSHLRAAEELRPRAEEIAAEEAAEPREPEPVLPPDVDVEPVPDTPRPSPSERDLVGELLGPIIVAAAGVLGLGAMGLFIGLREGALSERDALCPDAVCPDVATRVASMAHHADADTWTVATNIAWVSGAVLLTAGAAWGAVVLALGGSSEDVVVVPALGPSYAGAQLGGVF